MQGDHGDINIFSTRRYLRLLSFSRGLSLGRGKAVFRSLLRKTLNSSASQKATAAGKVELLTGMNKINALLHRIISAHLFGNMQELESIISEDHERYLIRRIFLEGHERKSVEMESMVVGSFKRQSAEYLAQREMQFSSNFQNILELMRSVIDDVAPK